MVLAAAVAVGTTGTAQFWCCRVASHGDRRSAGRIAGVWRCWL
ncbi:MAG: hypothetical protein U0401_34905 [Anaerolineae bacterium]